MDRTPNFPSFQPPQWVSAASRSPPQGQPCLCALSFVFLEDSSFYFPLRRPGVGAGAALGAWHQARDPGGAGKPAMRLGAVQGSCSQFKSHLQLSDRTTVPRLPHL